MANPSSPSLDPEQLNRQARQRGRSLYASARRHHQEHAPSVEDRLLEWAMEQPRIKTPLFRFVDVLPALDGSTAIREHFVGYFEAFQEAQELPGWIRWGLQMAQLPLVPDVVLAGGIRRVVRRLARRFIASDNREDLLQVLQSLLDSGRTFSVDRLGEEVLSRSEAVDYQKQYLDLLDSFHQLDPGETGSGPPASISLKLTALDSQFDPMAREPTRSRVLERLLPILRKARRQDVVVYLDMEQESTREVTLECARQILQQSEFEDWDGLGVVVQSYLKDSVEDVRDWIQWARSEDRRIWIRLVKGAYWDFERIHAFQNQWPIPVFEHKGRTDWTYEKIARLLGESHPHVKPAFGSHNLRSLAYGVSVARQAGLSEGEWECQMLYGMGPSIQSALTEASIPLRVYTPYGELIPGMAYLVRRLLENTSNQSFLRRTFHENEDIERQLEPPDPEAGAATPMEAEGYRTVGPLDYSKSAHVEAQQQALETVQERCGEEIPLLMGDQWMHTSESIVSRNPSRTEQIVGRVSRSGDSHVEAALEQARRSFPPWRDTDSDERAKWLKRLAGRLEEDRRELASWVILESGKNWREADADVMEAIDFCRYYARQMQELGEGYCRNWPGEENRHRYEPRGPAAIIPPWNFPLAILTGMTTAALVTGNPVLLKPSSSTPVVGYQFVRRALDAGLPSGVLQFLPGSGSRVGDALVRDPRINLIGFTGSRSVGLRIRRAAAEVRENESVMKQTVLEMGGKNAVIVDRDANLDEAVGGIIRSAFGYQGQKCSACSRVIVLRGVADEFLDRLVDAARSLRQGPAEDPAHFLGPVIDDSAREQIRSYQERARQQGEVLLEPDLPGDLPGGHYVGPMIVDRVSPEASIAREEIFGPLLSVLRVDDLDRALEVANGVPYALTGGLYSRNPRTIERVRDRFRVGNLYINRTITGALVDRQPFGGFKLSGTGTKAGGPDYLKNFLWPRTVTENTVRRGFAPEEHL